MDDKNQPYGGQPGAEQPKQGEEAAPAYGQQMPGSSGAGYGYAGQQLSQGQQVPTGSNAPPNTCSGAGTPAQPQAGQAAPASGAGYTYAGQPPNQGQQVPTGGNMPPNTYAEARTPTQPQAGQAAPASGAGYGYVGQQPGQGQQQGQEPPALPPGYPYTGHYDTPPYTAGVPQMSDTPPPKKRKKKRRFGCLGVLSVFLVLVLVTVGYVAIRNRIDQARAAEFAERFVTVPSETSEEKLTDALEKGEIDANTFVQQIAYSMFEPRRLSEAYRGDVEITTAPDIAGYIEQYGNELDDATMEYLCKKLLMVGVAIGPQESGSGAATNASLGLNTSATLVQTSEVETPEYNDNVRTLDKYALSPDGKFIIWYTESGIDAVTREQAEQIGVEMEALVAAEEALLGVTWEYEANYISFSKGVDIDKLDPDDYEAFGKAMPVFLIESSTGEGGALAYYFNTASALEYFAAFVGTTGWIDDTGILPSIYSWPFVGIQPSALQKPQDLSFILAHELTHHFQSVMGATNRDNITRETTANLVAATVVSTNSTDTIGNRHAQWYMENTRTSINQGIHTGGYSTFLFAKAYVDVVSNGWAHMMESFKQEDAFGYLVQQAGSQYREVWETLAVRNITQDYSQKSFLSPGFPEATLTLTPICSQQITLDYSAIDYYYIPLGEARSKEMIVFINPGLAESGTLSYCLMGGKNGSYTLLDSALIGAEETSFETADDSYKAYDELVLAVVNSSTTQAANYTVGSITRPLLALSNTDVHGMMMVGEDSLYLELEIDSFLQTMIDLFLLFNALDTDTGSAEINTVLRYYIDAANETAGQLQEAQQELRNQGIQVLRLYVRQLPPGNENLHKELKTVLSGITIKIADTESEGIHTTIYTGYNPLRPKHAEAYILQTYPDGTTLFYLITVN